MLDVHFISCWMFTSYRTSHGFSQVTTFSVTCHGSWQHPYHLPWSLIRGAVEVPLHVSHRQIIGIFAKRLINLLWHVGVGKKIWSKKNFCVGGCFNVSKTPFKKRHTCWTSQCVRSIGTIFPFLYLIGWSNSMDHKSRSRTKTDLKHNYPWISPPSHEQLKPLSKEKVNGYPGCLETPRLAPARCKRGSKMPGKSMHHMSWIKQNGREWNGTPDEFFFFA